MVDRYRYRFRILVASVLGLAINVGIIAAGRAYIDRHLDTSPCGSACRAADPYGLSHYGQGLGRSLDGLDRILIVALTYGLGILAVFVLVALARRDFEERSGATGLAVVGITAVTLVQLYWFVQAAPSHSGTALSWWVPLTLVLPAITIGAAHLVLSPPRRLPARYLSEPWR
jgi:hypothetical protein